MVQFQRDGVLECVNASDKDGHQGEQAPNSGKFGKNSAYRIQHV
jgi:hypothetical protein